MFLKNNRKLFGTGYGRDMSLERDLLTRDEERALIQAKDQGDSSARDKLIEAHLPLVETIAGFYASQNREFETLYSDGCLGLVRAVDRVSTDYDNRLCTYASWFIHSEISESLDRRGIIHLPRSVIRKMRTFFQARTRLMKKHSDPSIEQIAEEMGVSVGEALEMDFAGNILGGRACLNLAHDDEHGDVLGWFYSAEDRTAESNENLEAFRRGLKCLTRREAQILGRLFFFSEQTTIKSLANEFGLSTERIRQLKKSAIKKLRAEVGLEAS